MGTFDLEHVKVMLGSFGTLFSKLGHSSKKAHIKIMKMWAPGVYVECSWVLLILNMPRSFWESFSALFSRLVHISQKMAIAEQNEQNFSLRGV